MVTSAGINEEASAPSVSGNATKSAWLYAQAAGNMHRSLLLDFRRASRKAKRDPYRCMHQQLDELFSELDASEEAQGITRQTVDIVMGKVPTRDPVGDVRALRNRLLNTRVGNPVSLAIVSVALDSLEAGVDRSPDEEPIVVFSASGAADLMGVISGGTAGAKGGGAWGAVIVGVAVGAAASWMAGEEEREEEEEEEEEVLLFEDIDIPTPE